MKGYKEWADSLPIEPTRPLTLDIMREMRKMLSERVSQCFYCETSVKGDVPADWEHVVVPWPDHRSGVAVVCPSCAKTAPIARTDEEVAELWRQRT